MFCSECLSDDVEVREYDFGTCPQTGYLDAGERFRCLHCGATGDVNEIACTKLLMLTACERVRRQE